MNGSKICNLAPSRERGMTSLGVLILITFLGLFAFAAIRLTPIYLNYIKVAGILDGVYEEFDGQNPTRANIRKSIDRRYDVDSVSVIEKREIKVTADNSGFVVTAKYDHMAPFIGNIFFTVRFDKDVMIRR